MQSDYISVAFNDCIKLCFGKIKELKPKNQSDGYVSNSILITKIDLKGKFNIEKMDNKQKLYTVQSNVIVVQNKILFINNIYKNESINVIFSISGTKLEKY